MSQSNRLKKGLYALSALIALFGFSGCTWNEEKYIDPTGNNVDGVVTITVNIPGTQIPSTRSIDGTEGEAAVESIDVLVFKPGALTGDPELLTEHVKGVNITQSANKVQFLASLSANSFATTVMLVANASTETDGAVLAAGNVGVATKPDILRALTYASSNPGNNPEDWKWKANNEHHPAPVSGTHYTPIPMYGEHDISAAGITSGMKINDVELIRMLARIDVVNSVESSDFELLEVYVVNYNTAGYIAPAWDATSGILNSVLPATPMMPTIATNLQQKGFSSAMQYDYADLNDGSGIIGEIFTYEAAATTGEEGKDGHSDAACLILKGEYKGEIYFYRVDFTVKENATTNYIPLYRNHLYRVDIREANGVGYLKAADALKSLGIMSNLKTELLVVDESKITNIVFNGQHYLGVEGDVTFDMSANQTASVLCTTNYTYGWDVDHIEFTPDDVVWLTAEKETTTDVKKANLLLEVLFDNSSGANRNAYVYLTAGRLTYVLRVTQTGSGRGSSLRITNLSNGSISELVFCSNNEMVSQGADPLPQGFRVRWTPITNMVAITRTGDTNVDDFTWQDATNWYGISEFYLPDGGSYDFDHVDPKGFTPEEIVQDPFKERITHFSFLNAGELSPEWIDLKMIHYNLVAKNVYSYYMLNGNTYSFNVRCNTEWVVKSVEDPHDILDTTFDISQQTGGNDTAAGDVFTFKLIKDTDGSKNGYSFTIVFSDPTGKMSDVTVVIVGRCCGSNGTAVTMPIGENSYMTHLYVNRCWMVQNSIEGGGNYYSARYYDLDPTKDNGAYYTTENASYGCPDGWRLPTDAEFEALRAEVNADRLNTGRWWVGENGYDNGAFSGQYSGGSRYWKDWDVCGFWWSSSAGSYYTGVVDGMPQKWTELTVQNWFSVRCVLIEPWLE